MSKPTKVPPLPEWLRYAKDNGRVTPKELALLLGFSGPNAVHHAAAMGRLSVLGSTEYNAGFAQRPNRGRTFWTVKEVKEILRARRAAE